jgi:hypothetical protein
MKILKIIGWISVALGAILIITGILTQLFQCNLFHLAHNHSFLIAANSFLLLAIALLIATKNCCNCNCCNTKDEKPKV